MLTTFAGARAELIRIIPYLVPNQPEQVAGDFIYNYKCYSDDQYGSAFQCVNFTHVDRKVEAQICHVMGGVPDFFYISVSVKSDGKFKGHWGYQYYRFAWNYTEKRYRRSAPFDLLIRQSYLEQFFAAIRAKNNIP